MKPVVCFLAFFDSLYVSSLDMFGVAFQLKLYQALLACCLVA